MERERSTSKPYRDLPLFYFEVSETIGSFRA